MPRLFASRRKLHISSSSSPRTMNRIESELTTVQQQKSHSVALNVEIVSKPSAEEVVRSCRNAFNSGRSKSLVFRKNQLKNLLKLLEKNSLLIEEALREDLRKPAQESELFEIQHCINETKKLENNLKKWAKEEYPVKPPAFLFDKCTIYKDPYGVVLIMSAWNFPINLLLVPLAGAIAAGNCVILKPSEVAATTAKLLAQLIPKYLDKDCYQIYNGGIEETTELLQQRFDYIFFTGSTMVGRVIHAAANKYLTPITLELGGKCPLYLDDSVDMKKATKRILWGKFTNAGQICVAPDYLLCTKEVQKEFVENAKKILKEWYGNDAKTSEDYCRIITDKHFARLSNFIENRSNVTIGGKSDCNDRYIEPTILTDVNPNDSVMQEEIFGPILPIIVIKNVDEAINFINAREKPLATYIFTNCKKIKKSFLEKTSSGGVAINDTITHMAVDTLPFGGVGYSGMGHYHGRASFDTFSHRKSVLERNYWGIFEKFNGARYPPYSNFKTKLLSLAVKTRPEIPYQFFRYLLVFVLGVIATVIVHCVMKKLSEHETSF